MSVQVKGSGTIGGLDEGLVVSGIVTSSTQINVGSNIKLGNAGVITATTFVGAVTGNVTGNATGLSGNPSINITDLDVDGQTNLDHTSIVGIVTISAGTNNEGLRITGQHNNCVIFTSPSINGSAGYRLNHHPQTNFLRVDTTDQNGTFTGVVASFSSAGLDMADNIKLRLGTSQDLTLYHYGNDAYIDNATGDFYIRNAGSNPNQIFIQGKGGENSIVVNGDGGVEMFYDNSRKFFTQNLGVTVESYGNTPTVQFRGASNLDLGKIDVDQFVSNNSIMRFFTLASGSQNEAMRILDIGSVLIGCTSQANTGSYFQADNNDRRTLNVCSSSTATQNQILLRNPNGRVGSIQTNGTSTSFNNTFSDIASKKNFENWTEDVLSLFKNIKPQKFNFKVEDDSVSKSKGFIAQDMIDKFPEAYPKQEDEMYMFNPSGIVVYLMKGIQELVTKNDALEERIKNLEGS